MSNLITVSKVTIGTKKKKILSNISFKINDSDFVTILGANGSGKTLLVKSLLGLVDIDQGQINYHRKLNIGYLPQYIYQDKSFTITAYEFLKLKKKGVSSDAIDRIIDQTKLSNCINNFVHTMSLGQIRRLFMARALLGEPDFLCLDEPEASLDKESQILFLKLIQEIHKKNKIAIVVVSHNPNFIMARSNKVICLDGKFVCLGTSITLEKDESLKQLFPKRMRSLLKYYKHKH